MSIIASYVRKKTGFDALATDNKVRRRMNRVGHHWAGVLRSIAPHDTRDAVHYRDNIVVETDIVVVGKRDPRWSVYIVAAVPYARVLETGDQYRIHPPRPLHKLLDRIDAADPNKSRQAQRRAARG